MVESTALEMRRGGNSTVGSNPTLSAILAFYAREISQAGIRSGFGIPLSAKATPSSSHCRVHVIDTALDVEEGPHKLAGALSLHAVRDPSSSSR